METNNSNNNENINSNFDPNKFLDDLLEKKLSAKQIETQQQMEKQRFEEQKKQIEEEKIKLEEQKKNSEEQSKKFYEDIKNKVPRIDNLANRFKDNSDLQDGIGFLSSINALIENEEVTAEELTDIVKNKMTDEDFTKFKATDDASKITYKLSKICNQYKEKKEITNGQQPIPTNALKRNEPAEHPLLNRSPSHYQNSMFTPTQQINDFYSMIKNKK